MALDEFLTVDDPLGPIRHERILKRHAEKQETDDPINLLIYKVEPFDIALQALNPIVLGRRGAGKTAIIAARLSKTGHYYYTNESTDKDEDDIVVFIQSWDHLDEIVNLVGIDCLHSLGNQPLWDELLPETAARHWERHLWETVFKQVYRDSFSDYAAHDYRTELPLVFKFIEGNDIISSDERISNSKIQKLFEETRDSVINFLGSRLTGYIQKHIKAARHIAAIKFLASLS